jgi:hypothetical protein
LGLIPLGTLAFMAYLDFDTDVGDPLAFMKAHAAWGRSLLPPYESIRQAFVSTNWSFPRDMMNVVTFLDAVSALVFLGLAIWSIRVCGLALGLYAVLMVLIPLSSGSVKSMIRCEAVIFPVFFVLARWGRHPTVDRSLVLGFGLLLGVFALQFANWYWIG